MLLITGASVASAGVRPQAHSLWEVEVLPGHTLSGPTANSNCVVARRGGEQLEASDQSVGERTRFGLMASASLRQKDEALPGERPGAHHAEG
jgi:hypothetical protein